MQNPQPYRPTPLEFRQFGSGPAVLLVHGWMVSGRVWDRLLPLLPDFGLIVPDLPGSGATPANDDATLGGWLADLTAFCETQDLQGAHLVGHSMGGQLAALLATKLPQRFKTLTLMNPVPVQGLDFPAELQPLFRDCGGDRENIGRIIDMSCRALDDAGRELLVEDGLNTVPQTIRTSFDAFRSGDSEASLTHATMPATIIATDDPFLPAAFLQTAVVDRLSNARLVNLPGPGHYPQIEMPRKTAELLRNLLA